jgi:hypothetical protein
MIQLHKWYPFVHPTPYDVKSIAFEKRLERLQFEYDQLLKAQKMREAVEAYELELYNKKAYQTTVELEIFSNQRHFDKYV